MIDLAAYTRPGDPAYLTKATSACSPTQPNLDAAPPVTSPLAQHLPHAVAGFVYGFGEALG